MTLGLAPQAATWRSCCWRAHRGGRKLPAQRRSALEQSVMSSGLLLLTLLGIGLVVRDTLRLSHL